MNEFVKAPRAFLRIVIIIIVALCIAGLVSFFARSWYRPSVDPNKYQAIFLEGNQQYFGHLKNIGTHYPYLTDVYYVQVAAGTAENPGQQGFNLVKLGNEIHGPENTVYLNWSKVLFWENIKDDSQVVKGIYKEKAQQVSQQIQPTGTNSSSAGQ